MLSRQATSIGVYASLNITPLPLLDYLFPPANRAANPSRKDCGIFRPFSRPGDSRPCGRVFHGDFFSVYGQLFIPQKAFIISPRIQCNDMTETPKEIRAA
jgi:hypothetical protein